MFYALRKYSAEYIKERNSERVRRGQSDEIDSLVEDMTAYAERRKEAIEAHKNTKIRCCSGSDDGKSSDDEYEALKEYAAKEDRDHFGMTRIHDLYQRYYLRFGTECKKYEDSIKDFETVR